MTRGPMTERHDSSAQRIGRYAIAEVLARGAISEVVKAIDSERGQPVAIKILLRHLVTNDNVRARFHHESLTLTELQHPNIARIIETGLTSDDRPFFVMEFVSGSSLMDLIRDKAELSLLQQLDLMIQSAEGLRAALNRNIIHRDIKPANLMVQTLEANGLGSAGKPAAATSRRPSRVEEGSDQKYRLKIVDFGLAKIIGGDTQAGGAGVLLGTPRYMAPEVCMGRPADYRSDIYSLGATFYHLLTGRPPYDGVTPAEVMDQHIRSSLAPPYLFNPEIPTDVSEIIERAMAKDPAHRYQDYDEMLADLRAAKVALLAKESEAGVTEVPTAGGVAWSRPRRSHWRLWVVAAVVVAGLAVLVYVAARERPGGASRLLPVLIQNLLRRVGKEVPPSTG